MMAKVFPPRDVPTKALLSHFPAFIAASAAGMFLAKAQSKAMPCSAAATVFAVGALTTRQPCYAKWVNTI